jgi:hypothetical protein
MLRTFWMVNACSAKMLRSLQGFRLKRKHNYGGIFRGGSGRFRGAT